MDARSPGIAALTGWREGVAARVASPVAERTELDERTVRAIVGYAFLGLSLLYIVSTLVRLLRGRS